MRRYQTTAFRVAYLIVNSTTEAEDATQEALVRAYNALGRFRDGAPLRPRLLRIVANVARNRRVSAARRSSLSLDVVDAGAGVDFDTPVERAALTRERDDELLNAINHLRQDDRLIIACRYFLDLSEAETAAVLNCPWGTVKSRLSRSLKRLRAELDASGFTPSVPLTRSASRDNSHG